MSPELWVDLLDPDAATLENIVTEELHATARTQLLRRSGRDSSTRPRLESHGDHVFGVLVSPTRVAGDPSVIFQEIDVVVTRTRIVTVRKTPEGVAPLEIGDLRSVVLTQGESSAQALYRLVDEIAERFLTVIDEFDDEINELEDAVDQAGGRSLGRIVAQKIADLRHGLLLVRRMLTPTRDAARSVLDGRIDLDGEPELFPRVIEIHFADAYDKLLRATDGLDLTRDLLAGVRDYHQAQVANDQNEVMKRLTVVAALLLLPTFIVGLYGMNVKGVPEYKLSWGYGLVWVLIIATTTVQIIYFWRKRWIGNDSRFRRK